MLLMWSVVFLASSAPLVVLVQSTCRFPANWQANTRWFASYDRNSDSIWAYTFDNDNIRLKPEGGGIVAINYECVDSVKNNSHMYYMRKIGPSYECVQTTFTAGAMLQRARDIAVAFNSADTCSAAMSASTTATWLIKLPFNSRTDNVSPIPSRTYQTTYSESAGDATCSGDNASVAVVEGNTIKLNTCFPETTSYVKPLKTTLTVVAVVSGISLDSAANGDILLLGDFTSESTRFYCARYKITGISVKLSLDISDEKTAKCTKSQTYASVEAGKFVAFILTVTDITTETVTGANNETVTNTTTETVTNTTTVGHTTLQIAVDACESSPCQNGATCETTTDAYSCHCPPNYLGDHCETYVVPSSPDVLALVVFPVTLAVIIVVAVVAAVVVCQCRNRKQEKGIMRDNSNVSYFGFTSGGECEEGS